MKKLPLLPLVSFLLLVLSVPSLAVTVDEVAAMAESGVSEDVILALLEATDSAFDLSADDIVRLNDAGLSEAVLLAMIGNKPVVEEEKSGGDVYLQLSDDQFKRLYLTDEEPQDIYNVAEPVAQRQPEYYQSSSQSYGQGYVSSPNYSTPSFSSGVTRTTYGYVNPGTYNYNRKYYRPAYYYGSPGYYIYDGRPYYPNSYSGYSSHYPRYYSIPYSSHRYYKDYPSHSRGRVKYRNDDWYLSLGFHF